MNKPNNLYHSRYLIEYMENVYVRHDVAKYNLVDGESCLDEIKEFYFEYSAFAYDKNNEKVFSKGIISIDKDTFIKISKNPDRDEYLSELNSNYPRVKINGNIENGVNLKLLEKINLQDIRRNNGFYIWVDEISDLTQPYGIECIEDLNTEEGREGFIRYLQFVVGDTPVKHINNLAKINDIKKIDSREKRSWGQLVNVLCHECNIDISKPFAAAEVIQALAAKHSVVVPTKPDTIARRLKEILRD